MFMARRLGERQTSPQKTWSAWVMRSCETRVWDIAGDRESDSRRESSKSGMKCTVLHILARIPLMS